MITSSRLTSGEFSAIERAVLNAEKMKLVNAGLTPRQARALLDTIDEMQATIDKQEEQLAEVED